MIFLRYESFRGYIRMYPITSIMLTLNILMYVLTSIFGSSWSQPSEYALYHLGVLTDVLPGGTDFWRWISSMYLHFGFGHLLFNCFSIFIFSPPLERMLGHFKYFLLYLGSGIAGNLFTVLFMEQYFSLGASGAAYGLFGAYLHILVHKRHLLDPASRKTIQIFLVFGIVYSVIIPQINIMAHLGGLIAGFVLFFILFRNPKIN